MNTAIDEEIEDLTAETTDEAIEDLTAELIAHYRPQIERLAAEAVRPFEAAVDRAIATRAEFRAAQRDVLHELNLLKAQIRAASHRRLQ